MALQNLVARSLGVSKAFNWTWFIEICVCGILVLFFCFYFNRLFATITSYFIRLYTWRAYRIWIDVQAIQISLLGGRIFFKGVRYHGENETILVHSGHITFRYWARTVRQVDLARWEDEDNAAEDKSSETASFRSSIDDSQGEDLDAELGSIKKVDDSQARVVVAVSGVEWFIYNRTPLYDAIVRDDEDVFKSDDSQSPSTSSVAPGSTEKLARDSTLRQRRVASESSDETPQEKQQQGEFERGKESGGFNPQPAQKDATAGPNQKDLASDITLAQKLLVRFLPVYIECSRAAVSIGNEHTKALLVTTVQKAKGYVDASSCGPHDVFRQLFDFEVQNSVIQMKPNADYKASQMAFAERLIRSDLNNTDKRPWWKLRLDLRRRRHNMIHEIKNLVPWWRSSVESLHHSRYHEHNSPKTSFVETTEDEKNWHGLGRYLDEDESDDHQAWADIDYGRFSTLVDCPLVHLVFYWDVPGHVRSLHNHSDLTIKRDINGSLPPAYGLDLTITGGEINYGPWADRLRAEIQAMFLPFSYNSVRPATRLRIGEWRQSTTMIIRIDIEEEVTLRVPTREKSKDWRWRGRATAIRDAAAIRKQREKRHFRFLRGSKNVLGPDIRPFGWIAVSVGRNSSVRYVMDMVAGATGYSNKLDLDLKDTKATSSVNHAALWHCNSQKLQCDLSNPLAWNGSHEWTFNITSESMQLFLLRDHMFLLTDLIGDFTAGLKSDYMTFVPFKYNIGLQFNDLKLFLNANDFNIIDSPCDLENNAFLILGMQSLNGQVEIPMQHFSPAQSSVFFKAHGSKAYLDLKTPVWNTLHTFSKDEVMATLRELSLDGSYNYYAEPSPEATDSLIMNIVGRTPKFHLQGFLIRYFMNVKENYFGEHLHFRTLEEYQTAGSSDGRSITDSDGPKGQKDNDLDVILSVRAEESCAVMPANIYERAENLRVDVMRIDADMRFTNYYMDLEVTSSPIEVSTEKGHGTGDAVETDISRTQLYIDSVFVYGHRLFGAPPSEPTYVCAWDFDVGVIRGECSSDFLRILTASIESFVFTLDDDENALQGATVSILDDVTLLRARTSGVCVWVTDGDAAFLADIAPFNLDFNDWAHGSFSKNVKLAIPYIRVAAIDLRSAHRLNSSTQHAPQKVDTFAYIQTSLQLAVIDKKPDFAQSKFRQQNHISFHDLRTHRAGFLLHEVSQDNLPTTDTAWSETPPSMPVPTLPIPLPQLTAQASKSLFDASTVKLRRGASFLSSSSASSTTRSRNRSSRRQPSTKNSQSAKSMPRRPRTYGETTQVAESPAINQATQNQTTTAKSFSSPWMEPYFTLQGIKPDTNDLPHPEIPPKLQQGPQIDRLSEDNVPVQQDSDTARSSIILKLPTGLCGFCTPQLFSPLAALITSVLPQDAASVLDSIQRSTVSTLKEQEPQHKGETTEFAVSIPVIAFRLIHDCSQGRSDEKFRDQYDVLLAGARLMLRTAPTALHLSHAAGRKQILLAQGSLERVCLDVDQLSKAGVPGTTGLHASLNESSFWLSLQDQARADAQIGSLETVTSGSSIEKLASLVQRSAKMVETIVGNLSVIETARTAQQLVYHLAISGANIADPAFLSRPSYVLRSAQTHVRTSDSWKALTILRQRQLLMLPSGKQFHSDINDKTLSNAQGEIVMALSRHKTREHEDPYKSLMDKVFGKISQEKSVATKTEDVQIGVFLGRTSFLLDPGPRQSEILFENFDMNVSQRPVLNGSDDLSVREFPSQSRKVIKSWASKITIDLNWELVALVEKITTGLEEVFPRQSQRPAPALAAQDNHSTKIEDLMIVSGTDEASLLLHMVNSTVKMNAVGLKQSLTLQQSPYSTAVSLVLTSDSARSKLESKGNKLLHGRLIMPSVYGSYQQSDDRDRSLGTVRVAATCEKLRFRQDGNILSLLEVVHATIKDEVTEIEAIVSTLQHQAADTATPVTASTKSALPDFHLALLLDDYDLGFKLFPDLQYSIRGEVARSSVVSLTDSDFAVHIDIKRNHHQLSRPFPRSDGAISILEMPPVNAQIKLRLNDDNTTITAHTAIELIDVEASAVQACLDAAYQTENVEYLNAIQLVIEDIRSTMKKKTLSSKIQTTSKRAEHQSSALLYSGHVVLAGLAVRCSAPVQREQSYEAVLQLILRDTTLRIYNIDEIRTSTFDQLQFEINMPKVTATLDRNSQTENRCVGKFSTGVQVMSSTEMDEKGNEVQIYRMLSNATNLDLSPSTPAVAVDTVAYIQTRVKAFTANPQRPQVSSLKRLTSRDSQSGRLDNQLQRQDSNESRSDQRSALVSSSFVLELNAIQARWILDRNTPISPGRDIEDMVFSISKIDLKTQRESSARLAIFGLQLQLVPQGQTNTVQRTRNSALLPEIVFKAAHVSTRADRRFAFQAAGKALDLRLAADGILPLSAVQKSLTNARSELRSSQDSEDAAAQTTPVSITSILGNKRLSSLLVDADFAGAVLTVTPRLENQQASVFSVLKGPKRSRVPQLQAHSNGAAEEAVLRAPGVAMKMEYRDTGANVPSFSTEVKVAASTNTLAPSVVPLVLEIYSSIKETMGDSDAKTEKANGSATTPKRQKDGTSAETDPTAVLGRVKLNAGLWVQRQEFSLTCQPIARVQATALFDDIFVTVNTNDAHTEDESRFFSIITKFNKLRASVQHVYSRESTASFEVDSIVMSLMNSKHVNSKNGIWAILNVSPMQTNVNARQLQDFLLFREIWYPEELRGRPGPVAPGPAPSDSQVYALQKYQELTATAVLPWHAIVSVPEIKVEVDFGQSLGKSSFTISKLWASSKKNSDAEQNLCIGFDRVGVDSTGRMSGFVEIRNFRVRTSIRWPADSVSGVRAPLVQASLGFDHLRLKTAFDYQPFAVADISDFDVLMYNVRPDDQNETDRLVGILDGGKIQVFCISAAGGQALAIVQAFERLFQEKWDAYHESMREHERRSRRKSTFMSSSQVSNSGSLAKPTPSEKASHILHTDVVVTLKVVDIGAFPNTFFDNQILNVHAADVQARFAVSTVANKVRSGLGMSLGQVRVALSAVGRPNTRALGDVEISEVIERATAARGGTILKVPRLVASMQTWQQEKSNVIEYIFRSTFQGKVDVGWNYSRISFIRGMWETHCQALAHRLGKPLPQAAVKIKAEEADDSGQEKITAVVNVPQSSKYEYVALEPPVIDTPQLRDMGEATPPLEWIGLNRDKLPNVTHSIVIVSLLEVAREVEDAYTRILGTG